MVTDRESFGERREDPGALSIPTHQPLWDQIFSNSRLAVPESVHDDFIRPPTSFPHIIGGTPSGHTWRTVAGDMGISAAGTVKNATGSASTSILNLGSQETAKISAFIEPVNLTADIGIYARWLDSDNHILLRALGANLSTSGNDALRLDKVVAGSTTSIEIDMGITFPGTSYVITLEIDGPVLLGSIRHETNGDVKSLTTVDAKFNVEPNRSTPFVGLRIGANTTDKVKLFAAEIR